MPHLDLEMDVDEEKTVANSSKKKLLYKVVLTGGPCGGKTTGQARLCTFFENLGWKVFRVPETASVLLGGGIKFPDLDPETACHFQENLLKSMIQIENTFFELGEKCSTDCLIICDRGVMDVSAYMPREEFDKIMEKNKFNLMEYRDNRYNQIVHMVSAAIGAEEFYTIEDHSCRHEDVENARISDFRTSSAWLGHPYYDVIDNSSDFESKICRLIATICQKVGVDPGDRLSNNSKKRKWLIKLPLPTDEVYPSYKDFDVVHNYLQMKSSNIQARLRKRGQNGQFMYTHTIRRPIMCGQIIEVRTQLTHRDYINMLSQRDDAHFTIYKKRRSFIHNNQYFQLDVYREPCHPRCKGLVLLETYSALNDEELWPKLPSFLIIDKEVTGNPDYSMFNLSLREEWDKSDKFCKALQDKEGSPKLNGKEPIENNNNNNYAKCVIPNGGSKLNQVCTS